MTDWRSKGLEIKLFYDDVSLEKLLLWRLSRPVSVQLQRDGDYKPASHAVMQCSVLRLDSTWLARDM